MNFSGIPRGYYADAGASLETTAPLPHTCLDEAEGVDACVTVRKQHQSNKPNETVHWSGTNIWVAWITPQLYRGVTMIGLSSRNTHKPQRQRRGLKVPHNSFSLHSEVLSHIPPKHSAAIHLAQHKRNCFTDMHIPVSPVMIARVFGVFVGQAYLFEVGVE